jgi:outer membrane protein assembly factor BamE
MMPPSNGVFYMKMILSLFLITFCLTSCAYSHKRDIEQGNLFTDQQVLALRHGMSESDVKRIMGDPIMKNIFTSSQVVYVYTIQPGGKPRTQKQVICTFHNGRLSMVTTH